MNRRTMIVSLIALAVVLASTPGFASNFNHSNVGAGGYDVVAYHTEGAAKRGTGWYVASHEGTTYLFSSKKNRKLFVKNPNKYLPEYGGYCAYGLSVGKKFYADPTVWKVVDGRLFLNLDAKIQQKFEKDLSGNIQKADANWPNVKAESPAGL